MANLRAITFSTDGLRDYAITPDGHKHILGAVSVLTLVSKLVPSISKARRALDEFNEAGETMVAVDVDRMFEMLQPKRPNRYAELLIPPQRCTAAQTTEIFSMLDPSEVRNQIGAIEQQISVLNQQPSQTAIAKLARLVQGFQGGFQGESRTAAESAALTNNANVAETIIQRVDETSDAVDRLVQAGRRFNASKAHEDLHTISSRVAEILETSDLSSSEVSADLNSLAKQAMHIHGLFSNAE